MIEHLQEYLIFFCFLIWLIHFIYVKVKYPFWSHQPVFHTYDILRYYYSSFQHAPYVIQKRLPPKNRYFSNNVTTEKFLDTSEETLAKTVDFLQSHYVESDKVLTMFNGEVMTHDLSGTLHPPFLSLMKEKQIDYVISDSGLISQEKEMLVGCMTSRCMQLFLLHHSGAFRENVYFWDHICTHRKECHRNLGRNLLQSHDYYQRRYNQDIHSSVFKREGNLCEGVVPLMEYDIHTFPIVHIKQPPLQPYSLQKIQLSNASLLHDFLYSLTHNTQGMPFSCCIFPEMDVLDNLIQKRRLHVYALTYQSNVAALYFLKEPHMYYHVHDDERRIIDCIGSVKSDFVQDDAPFFAGFLHALYEQQKQDKYELVTFHEFSHNHMITDRWKWKYHAISSSKGAYYTHNMVIPGMPFAPTCCFVIT